MEYKAAYRKFGIVTIVAVYFLIFVGSLVRTTGSGMGCPDWPKCFGQYVPPTHISQLPPDYKERYQVAGREIADFDAVKTWIEYANRLVGALIGIFIFITFLLSFSFWEKDRPIVFLSGAAFLMVGFEGWLGAKVVSSNLAAGMITIHMAVALLIVAVLIYTVSRARLSDAEMPEVARLPLIKKVLLICIGLTFIQIVLGTQVREAIDHIAESMGEAARGQWIENTGAVFLIHRSFSILLLLSNLWLLRLIRQNVETGSLLLRAGQGMALMLFAEILTGVVMAYLGMPKAMQPAHLLLGSLMFGLQYFLWILANRSKVRSL